jgi:hypothetical protein
VSGSSQDLTSNSAGCRKCWPAHQTDAPSLRCGRMGFGVGLLVGLVGAALAVAKPQTMKAAGPFGVVRFVSGGLRSVGDRQVGMVRQDQTERSERRR